MIRTYGVTMTGFGEVFVRAFGPKRARILCAQSFASAEWGTIGDGLKAITRTRLAPEEDDRELVRPKAGPEGVCVTDDVAAGQRRHRQQLEAAAAVPQYIRECVRTAKRADAIAEPYAQAMTIVPGNATELWGEINGAILERWKPSTLNRIKSMAWRISPAIVTESQRAALREFVVAKLIKETRA